MGKNLEAVISLQGTISVGLHVTFIENAHNVNKGQYLLANSVIFTNNSSSSKCPALTISFTCYII